MWQALFANFAVAAIALVAWTAFGDVITRFRSSTQSLLFGAGMAIATIASMAFAYEPSAGRFYDLRGPLIALSAFFGGPVAAAITVVSALAFRLYLGGNILLAALQIVTVACIGLVGHTRRYSHLGRYRDIVGLAAAILVANVILSALRAHLYGSAIFSESNLAQMLLSFLATLALGILLLHENRRRELARSNLLYRSMVDALPDCLNIKDLDGRFLAANPATASLMRARSPSELIGRTDFDFFPHNMAFKFREDEQAVIDGGVNKTIEQRTLLPNGAPGWLSTLKALLRDHNGEAVGIITHNRDITLRKNLQLKLETTQAQLDQALENMSDGLVMLDNRGVILFCNSRYRQLFPRTAHLRIPGASYGDVIRASVDFGEERLPQGVSLEQHVASEVSALQHDGERMIELIDGRRLSSRHKVVANESSLLVVSDVTERWHFQKNLEHQALHDPLTTLANRAYFNQELARLLDRARSTDTELIVMLVDLDRFKEVNDNFGHPAGDALLVEVSKRLEGAMRRDDFVARLGGDEFAILAAGPTNAVTEVGLASRIAKTLSKPMQFGDVTLLPGGTIGYTVFPRDNSDADGLLKNADRALYLAKNHRRGSWSAHEPPARERISSGKAQ